eukprot:899732-Rhodomonas_salina.1
MTLPGSRFLSWKEVKEEGGRRAGRTRRGRRRRWRRGIRGLGGALEAEGGGMGDSEPQEGML